MAKFIFRSTFIVLCVFELRTIGADLGSNKSNLRWHDNETVGPYCKQVHEKYRPSPINVLYETKNVNLEVMWGARAPVRLAAALLVAVLRHVHGYGLVRLGQGPRRLCDLVSGEHQLPHPSSDPDALNTMYIHMGAEWSGADEICDINCTHMEVCNMAGPRLEPVGAAIAATPRLHARLAPQFSVHPICDQYHTWSFYKDQDALRQCGFFELASNVTESCPQNETCIRVLDVTDLQNQSAVVTELMTRAIASGINLHVLPKDRSVLLRSLNESIASVIFIDYEVWASNSVGVRTLQPPPCIFNTTCTEALDNTIALKVSDVVYFETFAPLIDRTTRNWKPNPTQLRQLLDLEAQTKRSDEETVESACAWVLNNSKQIDEWANSTRLPNPIILYLICDDGDPDKSEYLKISSFVKETIPTSEENFPKIDWRKLSINCTDEHSLGQMLEEESRHIGFASLAGVAAMGGYGALASLLGAENARHFHTQLALFGVPSAETRLEPATTIATGRHKSLVLAFRRFLALHDWKRIALISEKTPLANDFATALLDNKVLVNREEKLDAVDSSNVRKTLEKLKMVDARVFVVNTGAKVACSIVIAAQYLEITDANHVWIVREWDPRQKKCNEIKNMRVFSLSYAWRGRAGLSPQQDETKILGKGQTKLRANLDGEWKDRAWPLYASAFVDALLALIHSLSTALKYNPFLLYSLHDLSTRNIPMWAKQSDDLWGVAQQLRLGSEPQRAMVFVEEWQPPLPHRAQLLAAWRLEAGATDLQDVEDVEPLASIFEDGKIPHDGTPGCWTALKGEPFSERCLDAALSGAAVVLLLAPLVLLAAARSRMSRLKRRERALHVRLLARCERTAEALRPLLLPRQALTLHNKELGVGHFGRVRLGLLRLPHRPPTAVAAKALLSDAAPAEEAEFLREGCALAALQHAHVVRLLGVCAADGPPLLLMEHALFGDLLQYLHQRRHLAELETMDYPDFCINPDIDHEVKNTVESEAIHVSAAALTRLAKEAAEALAYLAKRRYVHRDVRAANCLIDANRSLKLADFGLARATNSECDMNTEKSSDPTHSEESYAYICRRRGVFPVPWMAPESLASGVFSAASDSWALGVLMLELATLGARPYGAWRPPKVLRYVRDGGSPPLPRDASYHLCEVTAMCWEREPTSRARSEAIQRYLVEHPRAVRPALRPSLLAAAEPDDTDCTDSGFGERDIGDWRSNPHTNGTM